MSSLAAGEQRSIWRLGTRCDSEAFDSDVIAMTTKGQRLGRRCRPLSFVRSGTAIKAGEDSRFEGKRRGERPSGRLVLLKLRRLVVIASGFCFDRIVCREPANPTRSNTVGLGAKRA
jgi:hypothetical protein